MISITYIDVAVILINLKSIRKFELPLIIKAFRFGWINVGKLREEKPLLLSVPIFYN